MTFHRPLYIISKSTKNSHLPTLLAIPRFWKSLFLIYYHLHCIDKRPIWEDIWKVVMLSWIERWWGGMIWTDRFYTVVARFLLLLYRNALYRSSPATHLHFYKGHNFVQWAQHWHLSRKSKRLDVPLFSGHLMTSGILGILLCLLSWLVLSHSFQNIFISSVIAQMKSQLGCTLWQNSIFNQKILANM